MINQLTHAQFIAANAPSVSRLARAAPCQENLGISNAFNATLKAATASCWAVRYHWDAEEVMVVPAA